MHSLYVTAPAGTADLAAEELAACGVAEVKVERGGVACLGSLEQAYRACLWSRVANRVLLWGMMSLAAGLAVVISAITMFAGSFMTAGIITLMSVLGLVHAGCLFFAFHPPAWYRAWLEQGSGAASAAA